MHRTILKKIGKFVSKHAQTILTVSSVAGVCEVAYITAKAAPIAKEALEEAKEEKGSDLTFVEKVKVASPIYAPVAASVALTSGLIIGNHKLTSKRIRKAVAAAVAARKAYMSLDRDFNNYRNLVCDQFGEDHADLVEEVYTQKRLDKIKDSVTEDDIRNAPGHGKEGAQLYWLPRLDFELVKKGAGDFFWATEQDIANAEGAMNKRLQQYGEVDVDVFRGYFDLPNESMNWGYSLRCECFGGYRESNWIEFDQSFGHIQGVWCTVLDYDRQGLCHMYEDACCGDNDAEDCQLLPFK